MPLVLVVDDQEANRVTLERILVREGWRVEHAPDGRLALERVRTADDVDVVITDLKMPGLSGLELLRAVRQVAPEVEVVLMTAYGTVETAVEAMKEGAYDYVTKPLRRSELVGSVRKALEKRALVRENRKLREQLTQDGALELIGTSPGLRAVLAEAEQVAPSDASVLILGESGTGKGLLARWIHERSRRSRGRLVTVNCAALPESLLESELFGHEAGAFTGAARRREGRFDLARGGTLFLDEITEVLPTIQVKLLRVLQEAEYERVGGTDTLHADVRVIAASNRDVAGLVASGGFREDLYYRLNVVALTLPPLRERPDDIPLLAGHFLRRYTARNQKALEGFSQEALEALVAWRWPGNVRELENAVERGVVLARKSVVDLGDLPPPLRQGRAAPQVLSFPVGTPLKDVERRMIEATLRHCEGDRVLAASLLGITARTIYRREADWARDGGDEPEGDVRADPVTDS